MPIKILYFASLRETLGLGQESLELPATIDSVATLRNHLAARGEPWAALAKMKNLRAAVNQRVVKADNAIVDGDEVAFFPPVTGG
jgi:molybdopterin synthase sulfur carrier subunit